ncbi:unnamed protein product, partial [Ixodes persulcatus]
GFFWHVSDFHFDKDYTTHGVREAMCHSTPNQLSSDDIGPYGDFKCDAPRLLVESAVAAMRRIEPDPDFVLWTGAAPRRDNLPHVGALPWSDVFAATRWLGELLHREFPRCPVVPSLGNHDCSPANNMPSGNQSRFLSKADLNKLLPSSAWSTFEKGAASLLCVAPSVPHFPIHKWHILSQTAVNASSTPPRRPGLCPPPLKRRREWIHHLEPSIGVSRCLNPGFEVSGPVFGAEVFPGLLARRVVGLTFPWDVTKLRRYGLIAVWAPWVRGHVVGFLFHFHGVLPQLPEVRRHRAFGADASQQDRLVSFETIGSGVGFLFEAALELFGPGPSDERPNWEPLYTLTTQYGIPDASTASMAALGQRLLASASLLDAYVRLGTALKDVGPCDAFCRRVQLCAVLAARAGPHGACLRGPTHQTWASPPPQEATTLRDVLVGVSVSLLIVASIVLLVRAKRARMMAGPRYGRFG